MQCLPGGAGPLPSAEVLGSIRSSTRVRSLAVSLSGIARDRDGGTLTAHFYVRSAGSASWNVANGARVAVTSGSRASYRLAEGRLQQGRTYAWSLRWCNAADVCAAAGRVLRFTTRSG